MKEHNTATHSVIAAIDSLMSTDALDANANQVSNLIAASISQLVPRDQRTLCTVLMDKKFCPQEVFRQLIIGDVDGLEHLVANAAWITQEHAFEVIEMTGASALARALARRYDLNVEVKRALRNLNDDATDRALELRQVAAESTPVVAPSEPMIDLQVPDRVLSTSEFQDYLAHVGEENASILATAISDRFDVHFRTALSVLESDDARAIAALFRIIGVQPDMAEKLFLRIRWRRYPDKHERAAFLAEFDSLTLDGATATIQTFKHEAAA
ncbi:MAG: hypothetical protein AAFX98_02900 [Pseudomonadota bacterium]